MYQLTVKISVILLALLSNAASFGMQSNDTDMPVDAIDYCRQEDVNLPLENIIHITAAGNGTLKNNMQKTCKLYNVTFSKKNDSVRFLVDSPLFTADKKDVKDLALKAYWYNLEHKEHIVNKLNSAISLDCLRYLNSIDDLIIYVKDIPTLRDKCMNNQLENFIIEKHCLAEPIYKQKILAFQQECSVRFGRVVNLFDPIHLSNQYCFNGLAQALHLAVLCDDNRAMHHILLQLRPYIDGEKRSQKAMSKVVEYQFLLKDLAKKEKMAAFEIMIQEDPYQIINSVKAHFDLTFIAKSLPKPYSDILVKAIPQQH